MDPYDLAACDAAVKEELAAEEPSVIISRRPCALLKYVKHPGPIASDPDKCVGCKSCMRIGCPAISIVDGKAQIDKHPLRGLRRLPAAVQVRRIRLYFFLKEKVGKKNFTFGTDPTF